MTKDNKYGLGIIGYGGMARHHHVHIAKNDRLELIGAYDINPERVAFAVENGIEGFTSQEALLADPRVNIVLVAAPNNFHKVISIAALRAGKHVVCEKPVTMDSAELAEITDEAEKCNRIFTVHQNRRADRDYLMVKQAIADGMVGKPVTIESRVLGSRGIPNGWRQYQVAGGGMMLDWGVHLIDQIVQMIPERVTSVYTHMFSVKYPKVDDYFKLLLRFESGLSAHIEVGTFHYIPLPRWYVAGDSGALQIEDWNCKGRIVRAKETTIDWEQEIVYTLAGPTKTMAPRPKSTVEEIEMTIPDTDYTAYYANLLDAIEGKAEIKVKPREAMRVMKIMEAAFLSRDTGEAIKVNI